MKKEEQGMHGKEEERKLINSVVSITLKNQTFFQGILMNVPNDWCY